VDESGLLKAETGVVSARAGSDADATEATPVVAARRPRSTIAVLYTNRLCVKISYGLLALLYLAVAVLCCLAIWQLVARHSENHVVAWAVAAMFVAIAVPLSLHEILLHVLHYTTPDLQRHAIRILGMIPIYAIESWCALRFKEQALVFETLREAYEAYVIWRCVLVTRSGCAMRGSVVWHALELAEAVDPDVRTHVRLPATCSRRGGLSSAFMRGGMLAMQWHVTRAQSSLRGRGCLCCYPLVPRATRIIRASPHPARAHCSPCLPCLCAASSGCCTTSWVTTRA